MIETQQDPAALEIVNKKFFEEFRIKQALKILETTKEIFGNNVAVAFSGGKDSLVILHLALKVFGPEIPVIYNNTSAEFPETVKYVRSLSKMWDLNLIVARPHKSFLLEVKERGWATHDCRWCCTPYKKDPSKKVLLDNSISALIVGTIRTESIYRRSIQPFKIYKQGGDIVRVHPIYDWNQQEVWNYIKKEELPYNPLYDKGYRRIGCWCCPLNGISHYKRLSKTHPKMYAFLEKFEPRHPAIERLSKNENLVQKVMK